MPVGQHVLMVVRHHGLLRAAGANLAPADDDRNVDALGGHRLQAILQLGAFGRPGRYPRFGSLTGGGTRVMPAIPGEGSDGARRSGRLIRNNGFSANSHDLILGH